MVLLRSKTNKLTYSPMYQLTNQIMIRSLTITINFWLGEFSFIYCQCHGLHSNAICGWIGNIEFVQLTHQIIAASSANIDKRTTKNVIDTLFFLQICDQNQCEWFGLFNKYFFSDIFLLFPLVIFADFFSMNFDSGIYKMSKNRIFFLYASVSFSLSFSFPFAPFAFGCICV